MLRQRALLVIALAAALHALVYVPFETHLTGDSPTYLAAAKALRHGSYSTPLRAGAAPATGFSQHPGEAVDLTDHVLPATALDATERQVWRAPVYPALLAAVGGAEHPGPSRDALYVVQALLIGLSTLLTGALAARLWGPRVGLAGAVLAALDPFPKRYAGLVVSESLAMALASLAGYALVQAWGSTSLRWWGAAGLAGGLLTLTRPGLVPVLLILFVAAVVGAGRARVRAGRTSAVLAAGALVVAPWLMWTATVTGTPTLQAYGSGVNLLVGARGQGPDASIFMASQSRPFLEDLQDATRAFPDSALMRDPDAHGRYLVGADRALRDRAISVYLDMLRSDPDRIVRDYSWRAAFLWMAHTDWYQPSGGPLLLALRLVDWLVFGLVAAGLVIALAGRAPPARALGSMLLATTLILATSAMQARFTMPLRPLAFALAALAVVQALRAAARFRPVRPTRPRPAVAG